MGKNEELIWNYWIFTGENLNQMVCKYCTVNYIKHCTRAKKHTSNCKHAPDYVKNEAKAMLMATPLKTPLKRESNRLETNSDSCEAEMVSLEQSLIEIKSNTAKPMAANPLPSTSKAVCSIKRRRQETLDGKIHVITTGQLKDLQLLLTKAMVSGGVSFNWLGNFHLKEFFNKLGTGFCVPSRKEAAGPFLESIDQEASQRIHEVIKKERHFAILPDGWTNIKGIGVINIMLANPNVCVFYKSFETGSDKQTADYLKQKFNKIIADIGDIYGKDKITGIVSDQGRNYLLARETLSQEISGLLSINCAAHMLNLLAADVGKLPSVRTFLFQAKSIVKEIKGSKNKLGEYHQEFDKWLAESENSNSTKVVLSLPCVTRWFGVRDMLYKLKRAKPVLERMAIKENGSLSSIVKGTIKNDSFWERLNHAQDIFAKITEGIAKLESNSSCLSDVVQEFGKLGKIFKPSGEERNLLENCLSTSEVNKARSIFEHRNSEANISQHHFLAYFLDPRYKGEFLMNDKTLLIKTLRALQDYAFSIGVAVSMEQKQELGCQLTKYRQREDFFGCSMLHHANPYKFWENYLQFPETNLIATVGCRILSIPASSAGVERSFSIQAHIHSKKRNRLSESSVEKLMKAKWFLDYEAKLQESKRKVEEDVQILFEYSANENTQNTEDEEEIDIDEIIILDEPFTETELLNFN